MANRYYGVSLGEVKATVDTSTTSKNMEFSILSGAINSQKPLRKADILEALDIIKRTVYEDKSLENV